MCFIGLRLKINLYAFFLAIRVPCGRLCHFVIHTDNPSLPPPLVQNGSGIVCGSKSFVFVFQYFTDGQF